MRKKLHSFRKQYCTLREHLDYDYIQLQIKRPVSKWIIFFINEDERVKVWRIRVAKKHRGFRKQNYITTYRIKLFISRIDDCCQRGKKCSSQSYTSMNFLSFFVRHCILNCKDRYGWKAHRDNKTTLHIIIDVGWLTGHGLHVETMQRSRNLFSACY